MAKYSEAFKIKLIAEYLHGNLGYSLLARKYKMPSSTPIRVWVRAYKNLGIEGLKRRRKKEAYSVQFKLDTLQFKLNTGASYQETADQFKLNNSSLIARWMREFNEQGVEGLKPKPKGRPSMSKKPIKPIKPKKKEETKLNHVEALERENELLRLENAYLKKLKAFRENQNAFHEKHKQNWHSNSNKKDSD